MARSPAVVRAIKKDSGGRLMPPPLPHTTTISELLIEAMSKPERGGNTAGAQ